MSDIVQDDSCPVDQLFEEDNLVDFSSQDTHDPPSFGGAAFHKHWA